MAVAEILAGIALVKSSVDFIKSNIDAAKDIGEIAGAIDGLFQGTDECQKARNKKSGVGRETHKMALEAYQQTKNILQSYSINPLGFF